MSSAVIAQGDPDSSVFEALLQSAGHSGQGYAWQYLYIPLEESLSAEQSILVCEWIRAAMEPLGSCHILTQPHEMHVLLCHTAYPAPLHRAIALWLACALTAEHANTQSIPGYALYLAPEGKDASEALSQNHLLPSYDLIRTCSPIPLDETYAIRQKVEVILRKNQSYLMGRIVSRDLMGRRESGQRCFGYIEPIMEALWTCHPSLPTSVLIQGLDLSVMTRRPREGLRIWFRTLSASLKKQEPENMMERIARLKQSIEADCSQSYTLEHAGQLVGMSPAYFSRTFHAQTGEPFSVYLTRVRMNRAKKLLQESRLSLQQIATECGYPSRAYFAQVFRHQEGVAPDVYAQKWHSS